MKLFDSLKRLFSNQQIRHFSFENKNREFSLDAPPFGAKVRRTSRSIRLRIWRPRIWPSIMLVIVLSVCGVIFGRGLGFEEGSGPLLLTMGAAIAAFTVALAYNIFGKEEFTVTNRYLIRKLNLFGIGIPHKVPLRTIERVGFRHRMPLSGGETHNFTSKPGSRIDSGRDLSSMLVLMVIGKDDEITVRDLSLAYYDYARFFLEKTIKETVDRGQKK